MCLVSFSWAQFWGLFCLVGIVSRQFPSGWKTKKGHKVPSTWLLSQRAYAKADNNLH